MVVDTALTVILNGAVKTMKNGSEKRNSRIQEKRKRGNTYRIDEGMNGRYFVRANRTVIASFVRLLHAKWFVDYVSSTEEGKTG